MNADQVIKRKQTLGLASLLLLLVPALLLLWIAATLVELSGVCGILVVSRGGLAEIGTERAITLSRSAAKRAPGSG
jgi:hypothetical protein